MSTLSVPDQAKGESAIGGCLMLARALETGKVSLHEYISNLTMWIVIAPGCYMEKCIELIPNHVLPHYAAFLQAELEPVDFMPYPTDFVVDHSEENIQKTKQEMRPAYLRLYRLVKERLSAISK
jgi:hypothetical protein